MNTTPRLHWDGAKRLLQNPGCGFLAIENQARYWWQSRMTLAGQRAPLPELVSLPALARSIRNAKV